MFNTDSSNSKFSVVFIWFKNSLILSTLPGKYVRDFVFNFLSNLWCFVPPPQTDRLSEATNRPISEFSGCDTVPSAIDEKKKSMDVRWDVWIHRDGRGDGGGSCNLSSDSRVRSKLGLDGLWMEEKRSVGAEGVEGSPRTRKRSDSFSCSLHRNVLCRVGRGLGRSSGTWSGSVETLGSLS